MPSSAGSRASALAAAGPPASPVASSSPSAARVPAWLLVFLGPFGWLVLVVLALAGAGRETLTIRLPYSQQALDEERPVRRARAAALAIALAALAVTVVDAFGRPGLGFVVTVAALLGAATAQVVLSFRSIDVRLDASRRWVTLVGVHHEFVAAVQSRPASSRGSAPSEPWTS